MNYRTYSGWGDSMSTQIDENQSPNASSALPPGTEAPAFTLNDGPDRKRKIALSKK
jgi:hypothetical protein